MRTITYAEQIEMLRGFPNPVGFLNAKIKEINAGNKKVEYGIISYLKKANLVKDDFAKWYWKEALKVIIPKKYKESLEK